MSSTFNTVSYINRLQYFTNISENSNFPNFFRAIALGIEPATIPVRVTNTDTGQQTTLNVPLPPGIVNTQFILNGFLGNFSKDSPFGFTDLNTFAILLGNIAASNIIAALSPGQLNSAISQMVNYPFHYSIISFSHPPSGLLDGLTADFSQKVHQSEDYQGLISPTNLSSETDRWFSNFLATYPYPTDGSFLTQDSFFQSMGASLATTAALQSNTTLTDFTGTDTQVAPIDDSADILRYETVFNTLFGQGGVDVHTGKTFAQTVQDFYQQQVSKYGYFDPSQTFATWLQQMMSDYNAAPATVATAQTSLAGMGAFKTSVLDRVYAVIGKMIDTVQDVAKAQAGKLIVFNDWQSAYTDLLTKVPVFLKGDPLPENQLGFDQRTELNATIDLNYRTQIQANQTNVTNDAKSLQSNINQSNDAVSQNSKYATSIVQTLQTLIGVIFPR